MNETRNNIPKEDALKQLAKDRETLLSGAAKAFADERKVSIEQIEIIEERKITRNFFGRETQREVYYSFRVKDEINK